MLPINNLEESLKAAHAGSIPSGEILKVLAESELWIPLPNPVGNDERTPLPIMSIDERPYVVAYTSAEQLRQNAGDVAHAVIGARELANTIPEELGLAINPGGEIGLPIHPPGVQILRGGRKTVKAGESIRLGEPEEDPSLLLGLLRQEFREISDVTTARRALVQVGEDPPGLLIGVTTDGNYAGSRDAVVAAVRRAVSTEPVPLAVDTIFLGNPEEQTLARLFSDIEPFYVRM
ncbi:MAG: enhanced serine sensitivity protein SseB C-terminal domain-containing protein [Streptomycetaceae bacterium]|nr:enhanced serine sensitivity protein SseB C-terminal domain-containing protein [Streptomycetaceae bacterium]